MTNLELSNALAHDAKLVLSFITEKEFRDLRDSLRSLELIAISYTLAKQEDDQATDSANTFATSKETDKGASKPVARHFNLPNQSKQHKAVCGLSYI